MLDINPSAVFTQALGFILLAFFLGKFVLPPVRNILDQRTQEITSTLDRVKEDRAAMERTRADYEQRLAKIDAEAREHIAGAVRSAQDEAAAVLAKGQADAAAQRDRALADIDMERKKAVVQIRSEMSELAVLAAAKILDREINPAIHRELISDFITDVSARS